jgi:hypothetical protein
MCHQLPRAITRNCQLIHERHEDCTRCTHKSLRVWLRDGPTEQYFAYEFDTTSVCAPGINLQAHTSSVRQTRASVLYRPVIMPKFVLEKWHLRHALLLFNQKKKAVESHCLLVVNTLHWLEHVKHGFDNLKMAISMWKTVRALVDHNVLRQGMLFKSIIKWKQTFKV